MAELQGLGAQLSQAERAGVEIVAVSPDPNERSQQVAEGLHLGYRFLADRDLAVEDDLAAVRGGVDALLAMSDRAEFLALCQTPEVPPAAQDRALASGQRRFAHWRQTVARMLLASGRPVPWPLAEPEPVGNLVPKGPETHAGVDDPGTASLARPMRPDGQPEEQGDPQPLRSAAPLDRPEHEGSRRTPGGPDPPLDQAPVGTGLRARLTRLVGWRREPAAESSRRP